MHGLFTRAYISNGDFLDSEDNKDEESEEEGDVEVRQKLVSYIIFTRAVVVMGCIQRIPNG